MDSHDHNEMLLSKIRDDFEPLPKHLGVTKRLYKPYEKFFTIETDLHTNQRTHQTSKSMTSRGSTFQ